MMTLATEQKANENLLEAFRDLKIRHSFFSSSNMELDYQGNSSIRDLINRATYQIDGLISKIQTEERSCESYLQRYCPQFYAGTSSTRVSEWMKDAISKEEKDAKSRIEEALRGIDDYVISQSRELAESFMDGLKRRYDNFTAHGFGRPWGTGFRQRLAIAIGLKEEVNSLWTLGLNSVANSQHVTLGEHFVELIKKDDAMNEVKKLVDEKIVADIKSKAHRAPLLKAAHLTDSISGSKTVAFGGQRNNADMLNQLKFTLQHPIESLTKYSATWNVAMQELTWAIRHGTVVFNGIYHAVYNISGFIYFWEMQFSIEDTFDLRPHYGGKLNFGTPYDIVTSILGSAYHDLLGNTDQMRVRAYWNELNQDSEEIHKW